MPARRVWRAGNGQTALRRGWRQRLCLPVWRAAAAAPALRPAAPRCMVACQQPGAVAQRALRQHIHTVFCALGLHGGGQLAQGLGAMGCGLPAARVHQCDAAALRQAQVGAGAGQPFHAGAAGLPGALQRGFKFAPGLGDGGGQRTVCLRRAGRAQLAPGGHAAHAHQRQAAQGARQLVGVGRQHRSAHANQPGHHKADPPRRAQQDGKQRILGHLEFHEKGSFGAGMGSGWQAGVACRRAARHCRPWRKGSGLRIDLGALP